MSSVKGSGGRVHRRWNHLLQPPGLGGIRSRCRPTLPGCSGVDRRRSAAVRRKVLIVELVVSDELEDRDTFLEEGGLSCETVDPDYFRTQRRSLECDLVVTDLTKPLPHARCPIGWEPVIGPDDNGAVRTQTRQMAQGPADLCEAEVAEQSAHKDEVSRHGTGVGGGGRGVTGDDVDAREPALRRKSSCNSDITRVEFDEPCCHVRTAWMTLQCTDNVTTLTCTHADHADGALWSTVQGPRDLLLDDPKPPRQRRVGIVVLPVPLEPVPIVRSRPVLASDHQRSLAKRSDGARTSTLTRRGHDRLKSPGARRPTAGGKSLRSGRHTTQFACFLCVS